MNKLKQWLERQKEKGRREQIETLCRDVRLGERNGSLWILHCNEGIMEIEKEWSVKDIHNQLECVRKNILRFHGYE